MEYALGVLGDSSTELVVYNALVCISSVTYQILDILNLMDRGKGEDFHHTLALC